MRFLSVKILLCIFFVSGLSTKQMSLEEDLTAMIDYEKYLEQNQSRRIQRELVTSNKTQSQENSDIAPHPYAGSYQKSYPVQRDCLNDECDKKVCADPENEVYQECGSKCVLGCRYATTTPSVSLSISRIDCEKNDCVEGCFCKTGLVRHQNSCIPALECPVRKCNHRYEVYMCGPAAPITCDNALRGDEISELTKHVDCVWGCFCAQGYLRNNYNGKCVPEQECRNSKSVDISPQIPGLFKHLMCAKGDCSGSSYHENKANPCGSQGCESNYVNRPNLCGPHGCHVAEIGCGPNGCDNAGQWNNVNQNPIMENNRPHSNDPTSSEWPNLQSAIQHIHSRNDTTQIEHTGTNLSGTRTTIAAPAGLGGIVNFYVGPLTSRESLGSKKNSDEFEHVYGEDDESSDRKEAENTNDKQMTMPMATKAMASKPENPNEQVTNGNIMTENPTTQKTIENQTPQTSIQAPISVTTTNKPSQEPVTIAAINANPPTMPMSGNTVNIDPNMINKPSIQTPTKNVPLQVHQSSSNTIPLQEPQIPQFPQVSQLQNLPLVSNGNNYFLNQQLPNNGLQSPFASLSNYPSIPNSPSIPFNPNDPQNVQTLFAQNNPSEKPMLPDSVGNRISPNYQQPLYNNYQQQLPFFNQLNPNQIRIQNPSQINPQFYNPVFGPNQFSPIHFNPNQFYPNPNQFNQFNPYANNFNYPGYGPTQFVPPNAQYSQYNQFNPFNAQNMNGFSNQPNPNNGGVNKQNDPVSHKQNKKPHKKQEIIIEQQATTVSIPNAFNIFNKKVRPFSDKQDAQIKST